MQCFAFGIWKLVDIKKVPADYLLWVVKEFKGLNPSREVGGNKWKPGEGDFRMAKEELKRRGLRSHGESLKIDGRGMGYKKPLNIK